MLLISDLHLEPGRPDISATLIDFLRTRTQGSQRLYILGDLFEVWIGDDAPNPLADRIAAELRQLADRGVEIFLMHGNRDFLIGSDYASRCGAVLIEEPQLLSVADRRIALLHGDVLCTRDTGYLQFRKLVRNPDWQRDFLARPLEERRAFARQARQQSRQATAGNAAEIMDVTETAVTGLFTGLEVDTVIHGHTHRPAIHDLTVELRTGDPQTAQRVVLGDWDQAGWYGQIDASGGVTLHSFPLSSDTVNS
ncbi:MAG: UDP-2,3-diacylglucosamine diphosphatase [Gammaproteobacteria bacterium]|nr:UDP-2,3-diacylglucosamine diphosphatase [Pseudomonadales bacterium]MCP5346011.1 UDP-2,3-diacylglucosamine diphosphatase [Pseudomonadales bacterium]